MAQLNFTLDSEFFTGLFSESKENAFAKLMETMLNQILKAESTEQLQAANYERTDNRTDYRNGTRARGLVTRLGKLELEVPRHRGEAFTTTLFEKYQRNEQALITTMMEMVLQGVSTRNIEKVTHELCGEDFSKSTVSAICKNLDDAVNAFKNRPLLAVYPFVMADALYVKVREERKVVSKAFFAAIGINQDGTREIIGFDLYDKESVETWTDFMKGLRERGLHGVDIVTSDAHKGLIESVKACFPEASWQRCQAHFARNIIDKCPKKYSAGLASELTEMFNCDTIEGARQTRDRIIKDYEDVAPESMKILDEGFEDAMAVMNLPRKYRISLRTSNIIERENREIRKREKVIGIFPNAASALRLLGAVLLDDHHDWANQNRSFNMDEYNEKREAIIKKLRASA